MEFHSVRRVQIVNKFARKIQNLKIGWDEFQTTFPEMVKSEPLFADVTRELAAVVHVKSVHDFGSPRSRGQML